MSLLETGIVLGAKIYNAMLGKKEETYSESVERRSKEITDETLLADLKKEYVSICDLINDSFTHNENGTISHSYTQAIKRKAELARSISALEEKLAKKKK